jgi:hypothetical protein
MWCLPEYREHCAQFQLSVTLASGGDRVEIVNACSILVTGKEEMSPCSQDQRAVYFSLLLVQRFGEWPGHPLWRSFADPNTVTGILCHNDWMGQGRVYF